MPTYPYECQQCDEPFEFEMRMSKYELSATYPCPDCGSEETTRVFTVPYVNFAGDGWATKNNRIAGQMADRRKRAGAKERDLKGDGMVPSLAPNVGGEQTSSWSDAAKLAKSKGKDTRGYERLARKESKSA